MARNPFVTRKWNHDPAARRRNVKAISVLERAKDHVYRTASDLFPGCAMGDIDEASEAALAILNGCIRAANADHDAAQRAAS